MTPPPAPHRLVDANFGPWMRQGDHENPAEILYRHNHTRELLPLATIERDHGPVRPVIPPPPDDVDHLGEAVRAAGRRALGTLAAALYTVEQRLQAQEPPPVPTSGPITPDQLIRRDPLTAGRPGSWEASDLIDFVWGIGPAVNGDHLDDDAHRVAVEIFTTWATAPTGYVEFAETIPAILGPIIDEGGGLHTIAEDWLCKPGRTAAWATSRSEYATRWTG